MLSSVFQSAQNFFQEDSAETLPEHVGKITVL